MKANMKENRGPIVQAQSKKEQHKAYIREQIERLPRLLIGLLKKKPKDISPLEALFLFQGYAEMLVHYDKVFFPQNIFAHNEQAKEYWRVVSQFKQGKPLETHAQKALQYIHALENTLDSLNALIIYLNYFKEADTKEKLSDVDLTYYTNVVDAVQNKINAISSAHCNEEQHPALLERVQKVNGKALRHTPEKLRRDQLFERYLLELAESHEGFEKIWDSLDCEQITLLGRCLYEDHYRESKRGCEFIRHSEIYSLAMMDYLMSLKTTLLPIYSIEGNFEGSVLLEIIETNFAEELVEELQKLEPEQLRACFVSKRDSDKRLLSFILHYPECYRRLFLDICDTSNPGSLAEIRKVCANPLFIEGVQTEGSALYKWFRRLPETFMLEKTFSNLRTPANTWTNFFKTQIGLLPEINTTSSPIRAKRGIPVLLRETGADEFENTFAPIEYNEEPSI